MYRDVKKWMALNAFTAVLKIFKYLKLSSRMNSLWEVLERALSDMLAFMLILFFIMAGFGVFGVVLFGGSNQVVLINGVSLPVAI